MNSLRVQGDAIDHAMNRWGSAVVGVAFVLVVAGSAAAQSPELPLPAYDTTFFAFSYVPAIDSVAGIDAAASVFFDDVAPGPYLRLGMADYFLVDMPWTADLAQPVLSRPTDAGLRVSLGRLQQLGLAMHLTLEGGMSRAQHMYTAAKLEDRRNAQWYQDGRIIRPAQEASAVTAASRAALAYTSASRYARKVRRHMETKVRTFAAVFLDLRRDFPETLVSASGCAEAELNSDGENPHVPFEQQPITDYSPFAILEFRDWLLHTGLYADDGSYAGEGYQKVNPTAETFVQGGPEALGAANLDAVNAAYHSAFTTFDLRYYHWSLDDSIDGDPHALPSTNAFTALPTSGPSLIAGGFDAPRAPDGSTIAFWDVWQSFRKAMLGHYVFDFAAWMTTTEGEGGATIPPTRFYSHQFPADYLNGTHPGSANPEPRLFTSASVLATALLPPALGLPGLTVLDRFELASFGVPGGYNRTSAKLLPVLATLDLPDGWGAPEYNPSWHIDVPPDTNVALMRAQAHLAYEAGMRMFAFTPSSHLTAPIGTALRLFLDDVKFQPRQSPAVDFTPPQVVGLLGVAEGTGRLSWRGQIFAAVSDFSWEEWPDFGFFEVWSGATADFTEATGTIVGRTRQTTLASLETRKPKGTFFKVRAVSRAGVRGPLSTAVAVDLQAPKCQRTIAKAAAKLAQVDGRILGKCDVAHLSGKLAAGTDCRNAAAPALAKAATTLAVTVGKACGGGDKACGGSRVGETSGTRIGWPAVCSGLDGVCAALPIGADDCSGVAACLACVAGASVDGARAVTMAPLARGGPPADKVALTCVKRIAQEARKLGAARSRLLQKCWDKRLGGKHANDCPAPGDGKTVAALAKATRVFTAKVCKACGGPDKACGGTDDLMPSTLGFAGACPAVVTPAGTTCGGAVTRVADLAGCVACATEHGTDCTDRLAIPHIVAYPDACVP